MSVAVRPITLQLDFGSEQDRARRYARANPEVSLSVLLQAFAARSTAPVPPEYLGQPLKHFLLECVTITRDGVPVTVSTGACGSLRRTLDDLFREDLARDSGPPPAATPAVVHPDNISDNEAVRVAYRRELQEIARFLKNDLSVLVLCDKILTEHVFETVCKRAGRIPVLEDAPGDDRRAGTGPNLERTLQGANDPAKSLASRVRTTVPL